MIDPAFVVEPVSEDIRVEKVTEGKDRFSVVYFEGNENIKALVKEIDNAEGRNIYQASFNNIKSSYIRDNFENAVKWCENTLKEYLAFLNK